MLRLLLTVLLAVGACHGCGVPAYLPAGRIVNGEDAVAHSWPWMASLQYQMSRGYHHSCGGSLISPSWVLTAAHCLGKGFTYRIVLGEHDRSMEEGPEQYFAINKEDIFVHPKWDNRCPECGYDIALIKLPREAELNDKVQLGCLPHSRGPQLYANQECYNPGWGTIYTDGPQALILQQALLPIVDHAQCTQPDWWGHTLDESLICAGANGQDSCHSDSGGPLNCKGPDDRWYIQGIVSYGVYKCNTPKKPTIFTRVSLFMDWMEETIANN
ncbi:chymotrypsin-like elastase family member 3B [Dendropsophus ebraccatus]|uniref:chymotrypsin-like elastase family member 3B n=1 Tax=Dendropsophus ebraccatus TaxID=150705 RepID=UPI0038321140